MIFVKNIFQLDSISSSKTTSGNSNSSSSSTKLRKETLFIYFELKKLNKLSIIPSFSQKPEKDQNLEPVPTSHPPGLPADLPEKHLQRHNPDSSVCVL